MLAEGEGVPELGDGGASASDDGCALIVDKHFIMGEGGGTFDIA
jgi:hypothetical protein